jgi:uncharacterized protein with gpF-like domain
MALREFDQLNIVQRRSIPYDEYFGDMALTKEQIARRKTLAIILEDIIAVWLIVMEQNIENDAVDEIRDKQRLTYMIYDEVSDKGYFSDEKEQDRYINNFVDNTYQSTVDNRVNHPDDYVSKGDKTEQEILDSIESTGSVSEDSVEHYWTSEDRAKFIAENEANTLFNSKEFIEAKAKGYTHKIWMAYPDDRVRPTHVEVDGAKVPIGVYFDVGRARMLYPKDVTSEFSTGEECPEEIVNCRCTVIYV